MKLKTSIVASALLSILAFSTQAAQELTPEKAASLQPFKRISFYGRYDAIYQASDDASKHADEEGADAFYIQATPEVNGGRWQVFVDLYHKDAPPAAQTTTYREFSGVRELPKSEAAQLEPFDTVTVNGYFASQPDVNDAIGKAAQRKDAYAFFIARQADINADGSNQTVTAFIYKKDAPKRQVQKPNAVIPADSEAGKAALAVGGAAAAKVEIPGVASSTSLSSKVGNFFQTQSSNGESRYTVTLRDGTKVQELNNASAAQMAPFDSITIRGTFNSPTDISETVAKRAGEKGAKYYHITRQWEENGSRYSISADLYK